MVDTRGDRPRLLSGASSSWLGPQVRRSDDLGATWQETPDGAIRFPEDVRRLGRAGLAAGRRAPSPASSTPAPSPARSGAPTDGGESFALERALWDHPHRPEWGAGFGGQAFHTILPHPTDPQSVTAAISTGGVYQTNDGGGVLGAAQPGHPGGVPARGPAVPRVRPVRAQGDPAPVAAPSGSSCRTTAASTAPTTTAPTGSRSPTACRPTSASRSSCTRTSRTPSSCSRSTAATAATRRTPRPGSGARRDAGDTWEELGNGLPDDFYVGVMRDAMCADDHDPAGLYFGARNGARLGLRRRRRDLAAAGQPTCPT